MHLSKKQSLAAMAALALGAGVVGWLLLHSDGSRAAKGPRKIGIIQLTEAIDAFPNGMKQGLLDYGYVEGRDVVYEYRNLQEDVSRAAAVASEFVANDVDLLFVTTNPPLAAALEATRQANKDIPIVFVGVDKPVESGLIASLTSTGNNATGILGSVTDNVVKQLSILREMAPKAKRVGYFGQGFFVPEGIGTLQRAALIDAAPKYGFELVEFTTTAPPDPAQLEAEIKRIGDALKPGELDAIMHIAGHYHPTQQFMEIALAERLKGVITIEPTIEEVKDGGIMGYAPDLFKVGQDSAGLIDRIFRGARPEDMPVELPLRNELWVNLAAAKRAGVVIPDSVLIKADNRITE